MAIDTAYVHTRFGGEVLCQVVTDQFCPRLCVRYTDEGVLHLPKVLTLGLCLVDVHNEVQLAETRVYGFQVHVHPLIVTVPGPC